MEKEIKNPFYDNSLPFFLRSLAYFLAVISPFWFYIYYGDNRVQNISLIFLLTPAIYYLEKKKGKGSLERWIVRTFSLIVLFSFFRFFFLFDILVYFFDSVPVIAFFFPIFSLPASFQINKGLESIAHSCLWFLIISNSVWTVLISDKYFAWNEQRRVKIEEEKAENVQNLITSLRESLHIDIHDVPDPVIEGRPFTATIHFFPYHQLSIDGIRLFSEELEVLKTSPDI